MVGAATCVGVCVCLSGRVNIHARNWWCSAYQRRPHLNIVVIGQFICLLIHIWRRCNILVLAWHCCSGRIPGYRLFGRASMLEWLRRGAVMLAVQYWLFITTVCGKLCYKHSHSWPVARFDLLYTMDENMWSYSCMNQIIWIIGQYNTIPIIHLFCGITIPIHHHIELHLLVNVNFIYYCPLVFIKSL